MERTIACLRSIMTDSIAPLQDHLQVIGKTSFEDVLSGTNTTEHVELALHTVLGPEGPCLLSEMEITPTRENPSALKETMTTTIATITTTTYTTTTATALSTNIVTTAITSPATASVETQSRYLNKDSNTRWDRVLRMLSRCIVYCSVRIAAGFGISRQQSGWYKHCWDTPGRRPPDFEFLGDAANQHLPYSGNHPEYSLRVPIGTPPV